LNKKNGFKVAKKVFNILTDVVLYPIILLAMIIGLTTLTAKGKSEIKKVFGYTVVTILSGSMEKGGFYRNDVVLLGPYDVNDLRPGDIIAFYYPLGLTSESKNLTEIDFSSNQEGEPGQTRNHYIYPQKLQDVIKAKAPVYFHRIHAVFETEDGTRYFQTKGDSIDKTDHVLVKSEFIVGKYINTSPAIRGVFTFMATPKGLIYIVIVPLSILIFFQIIEVVTIIFAIMTEKKVLAGEIPFDSEESLKAEVGKEMRDFDKVYFYDISKTADKPRVKLFLWGHLNEPNANAKQKKQYADVEASLKIYETSRDEYWKFWILRAKNSKTKRKLQSLQHVSNILHKAVSTSKQEPLDLLAKRNLPQKAKKVEDPGFLEIKKQTQLRINKESNKKD
jgi:signal peptidase I